MASKTGKSSSPPPTPAEGDSAAKPARRGRAASPAAAESKAPATRRAPARKAPGAGVADADVPAAAPAVTPAAGPATGGGRARRAAPGTGVAETGAAAADGASSGARSTRTPATKGAGAAARKPAARKPASGKGRKRESFQETAARRKAEKATDQLQDDLRAFAAGRPGGWNHGEWVEFLAELAARGHDASDPEHIGARLERERLALCLEAIQGVGPKRVDALTSRFQTLWSARHASAEEIAQTAGIPLPQAERVLHALREL